MVEFESGSRQLLKPTETSSLSSSSIMLDELQLASQKLPDKPQNGIEPIPPWKPDPICRWPFDPWCPPDNNPMPWDPKPKPKDKPERKKK